MIKCVIQQDTEKKMSICGKCVAMVKMKEEITLKRYMFVKRDYMDLKANPGLKALTPWLMHLC